MSNLFFPKLFQVFNVQPLHGHKNVLEDMICKGNAKRFKGGILHVHLTKKEKEDFMRMENIHIKDNSRAEARLWYDV